MGFNSRSSRDTLRTSLKSARFYGQKFSEDGRHKSSAFNAGYFQTEILIVGSSYASPFQKKELDERVENVILVVQFSTSTRIYEYNLFAIVGRLGSCSSHVLKNKLTTILLVSLQAFRVGERGSHFSLAPNLSRVNKKGRNY